jgi:hypothetical protein
MPPPEVWGPAVWNLFHTLCEQLNENAFKSVAPSLFNMIVRICKFLPCPDCALDATIFLANIKFSDIKNKTDLKNMIYLFHNWVNAKKKKRLFNYANMNAYANYNLLQVVNNFIEKYNTTGNMKLLTESFQRQLVKKEFIKWFNLAHRAFIPTPLPKPVLKPIVEPIVIVEQVVTVEPIIEPIVEQVVTVEPIVEQVVEDVIQDIEEPIVEQVITVEPVIEEPIVEEEPQIEEPVLEEPQIEEPVVEEPQIEVVPIKSKKGKKNKK